MLNKSSTFIGHGFFVMPRSTTLLFSKFLVLLCLVVCVPLATAQGDEAPAEEAAAEGGGEAGEAAEQQAIYLPFKPPFIINYGGAGRLRYLKAEISVRAETIDAANAMRKHMPYVRNNLLMLFASQTNETVSSQEGKEKLRADALEEIRDIVEREAGIPREAVVEVFFNNFVVQK